MTLGDYLVRVPTYLTSRCWNAQIAIADSRDFLILPSVMISLAIVATGTLDLGHGIIISRDDVGLAKVFFLEHGLRFNSLKFGVEVRQALGATVGPTSSIGERVVSVLHFVARSTPVAMQALAG